MKNSMYPGYNKIKRLSACLPVRSTQTGGHAQAGKKHLFRIGLILIAISFLVYPFYLYIPVLPFTAKDKSIIFVASSIISWGSFGCGTILSGKEGYPYLKSLVKKLFRSSYVY